MAMDSELLQPDLWTSGAQRSLDRATRVAQLHCAASVGALHLAWALLMDEGRAGSQLREHGLSAEMLHSAEPELARTQLADLPEAAAAALTLGAQVGDILREARHLAYQANQTEEAGTDHLLAALLRSHSPDAEWLIPWRRMEGGFDVAADSGESVADFSSVMGHTAGPVAAELDLELREREPVHLGELYRILDAAANRAREGLRVVEDYARFGINDRHLCEQLKHARHLLTDILEEFPQSELLSCRDTLGDVGTTIETRSEYHRTDVRDVVTAAFKRIQEAARTLEEFTKVLSSDASHRLERLRYQIYTLEKGVLQTAASQSRLANHQLYLLLTDSACPGGIPFVLKGACDAGVRLFQVREKSLDDRALLEHCRRLRRWTRERDALLIVNDRPDIAVLADADGVHLGQDELTVADARRIVGPRRLIGVSTHSIEHARQAVLDGADYLGVGPTFPSQTKTFRAFPGLELVRQVAAEIALPWFAIGGINEETIDAVISAGACRVAVTQAISASPFPLEAAATLLRSLEGGGELKAES